MRRLARLAVAHVRPVGWALGGRIVTSVAGVATTILTTRALGPSERGVFALAVLAGAFVRFLPSGFSESLAYELVSASRRSAARDARDRVSRDAWRGASLAAIVLALASTAIVFGSMGLDSFALAVAGLILGSLVAGVPGGVVTGFGLADRRMKVWAVAAAASQVGAFAGVAVVFALGGRSLLAISAGWAFGCAVGGSAIVLMTGCRPSLRGPSGGSTWRQTQFSARAAGSALLTVSAGRIDIIVLGVMTTSAAVGYYSVAVGAGELVLFLGVAIQAAIYGRLGRESPREARRLAWVVTGVCLSVAAIQALILAAVAYPLTVFLFGETFRQSAGYLLVLLPGAVLLSGMGGMIAYFLNSLGRPGLPLMCALVNFAATGALCLVLIPPYGAYGAAASSSIGTAASFLACLWAMRLAGRRPDHPVVATR